MPYIYKSGLQFGINETNIYGGASCVELTQAEYDALSDAEKHNGQIYFITDGNYDFLIVNDSVPIGSIQAYGGATAPSGWLICDGSAISRTDYKELFQAIGISFGIGDGSTTFNVPDFRGRVLTGVGELNNISYTLGEKKEAGLPNITGAINASTSTLYQSLFENDGTVTKSGAFNSTTWASRNGFPDSSGNYNSVSKLDFNASNSNSIYGNSTTVQPNTTVANYIIKAKNPSITSGQQLQAMELFYPVGSYFETSDSTFDPNVEWGGTWEVEAKQVYRAAWTATSTNANKVKVTDSLVLPKGTYIVSIKIPVCSQENPLGFATNLGLETGGLFGHGQGVLTSIITLNSETTIYAETNMSQATTYTYIERGYLKAVPISLGDGIKWHRTA